MPARLPADEAAEQASKYIAERLSRQPRSAVKRRCNLSARSCDKPEAGTSPVCPATVPQLSPLLAQFRSVLPTGRTVRIGLMVATAVLFAVLAVAHGGFSLVGAPITTFTRAIINVASIGFAALLYLAATPWFERSRYDPLRALWRALLMAVGLLMLMVVLRMFVGEGHVNARTSLSGDLATAISAVVLAFTETFFAVVVLHSLRPLVLFRRRRRTRQIWRAMLVLMGIAALSTAFVLPTADSLILTTLLVLASLVPMVYCAFRLGWIVPLTFRHKLLTMLFSAGLAGLIGLVLFQQFSGLASAAGAFAGVRVPYLYLFSRSLGELVIFGLVFGFLYTITAVLSLLFHLPTTQAFAQQTGEIRAFKALAELSSQVLDRDQLVETISGAPVLAGIAESAWLALIDPASGSLAPRVVAASGISKQDVLHLVAVDALVEDVAQSTAPLLLGTAAADHRVHAKPRDHIGSLAVLPLMAGGQSYGALFAAKPMTDGFEDDDVTALATFAGQAALALSHASLFQDALEKERLARELALAREVQQRLLPQSLPEMEGAELAVAEQPAEEIAGDYYDVVDLGEGCFGILIADVAGKGAAAAFYMAQLKGVVQSSARTMRSPGAFLALANEALTPSLARRAFISAVYGILDTREGTFTLARAGHCPIVMARADDGPWLLRADGLAIGLDPGPLFRRTLHEQVVRLVPGDVFALYTDGLVEARNADGEEYGYDRLTDAIHDLREHTASDILGMLLSDQRDFAGSNSLTDDLTVVILKWNGLESNTALPETAEPFTIRPAFP